MVGDSGALPRPRRSQDPCAVATRRRGRSHNRRHSCRGTRRQSPCTGPAAVEVPSSVEDFPCLVVYRGAAEGAPSPALATPAPSRAADNPAEEKKEEAAAVAARKLLARLALRGWHGGTFGNPSAALEEGEEEGESFRGSEGGGRVRRRLRNSTAVPNGRARGGPPAAVEVLSSVEEVPYLVVCPGAAEGAPSPPLSRTAPSWAADDPAEKEEEAAAAAARKLLARMALRGWHGGTFGSPSAAPGEEEEEGESFHGGEDGGRVRRGVPNSTAAPNGRARGGRVASGSPDNSAGGTPVSPRGKGRVRFDLSASTVHEVIPYSEIYGKHPREFVFDRHFSMVPAAGAYGFVGLADTNDGDEEEEDEEVLAEAEVKSMSREDGRCGVSSYY